MDRADDEQAAARGAATRGSRTTTPAVPVSCLRTVSSTSASPSSPTAINPATGRAVRTARELSVPCAVELRGQLRQPEQLARVGVLRHRRAQHEGRLPGVVPSGGYADSCAIPPCSSYTFNQAYPISSRCTCRSGSRRIARAIAAFFVQDTWTRGRLTLQGALRYDRAWSWSPAEDNGTTCHVAYQSARRSPCRATASVDAYNDITPRVRALPTIVFGNGQDGAQVQHGPLPRRGDQRQRLHAQQPGELVRAHAETGTGRTPTATASWTATC